MSASTGPIDARVSEAMFDKAGITRERLMGALVSMGTAFLPGALRDAWSPENPTRNFCYVIAEVALHWLSPDGSKSYSLAVDDPAVGDTKHYFVRWADGTIIDIAAEQFADYSLVVYENAKKQNFRTPVPSQRATVLAASMGLPKYGSEEFKAYREHVNGR